MLEMKKLITLKEMHDVYISWVNPSDFLEDFIIAYRRLQ